MGNHLAATSPSQILSVDSYLGDATEYQFDKSLGSTRFMKVARVKYLEGYAVVKVFAIQDPSLDLTEYRNKIEIIQNKLKHASNCLPFQNIMVTEKAALLFRQYMKHNLYDRISTRPFFNTLERRWVAFQLLCALNQMAKLGMCHGDIKTENIMITGWNWLLLTDFASFKPTYLPDDNPADFNYFFDTSRHRICYIAPERFIEMSSLSDEVVPKESATLDNAMDIFSAGCVIAELFTDGACPFDFSQLLAFREGKYYPDACLGKIDDPHIRSLVEHMIQREPQKRHTAEQYLTKWKGTAFPLEFYSYLKKYLGRFCEPPLLSADQTINTLHSDIVNIQQNLVAKPEEPQSLIIVTTVVLSCLRHLKYCNCKLKALEIIMEFSKHLSSLDILERIVPYLMELVSDDMPRVRAQAFHALAICTSYVRSVPEEEVSIFPDYIFPGTSDLAQDNAVLVRQSYAQHISLLAETSLIFLDNAKYNQSNTYMSTGSNYQPSYDFQLQNLHQTVQDRVQAIFTNTDSTVRQCLLEHSVAKLCCFFGRHKCNDVILSHMITFLNDKHDWQLRSSFFDSLVHVAVYVGWQSSVILKPLLQQGLNDSEEFVISKTLNALTCLTEAGVLSKQMMFEVLRETLPLLQHPCKWIRLNTIGFLSTCTKSQSFVEVHCHILPKLEPYLSLPIIQLDSEAGILSVLQPAVKRPLYDLVLTSSHIGMFFNHLQYRNVKRQSHRKDEAIIYDDRPNDIVLQTLQKLLSHGLRDEDEEKLLNLCEFMQRQSRHRDTVASISANEQNQADKNFKQTACIDVTFLGAGVIRRHADLYKAGDESSSNVKQSKRMQTKKKMTPEESLQGGMNEEWKSMFGGEMKAGFPTDSSSAKKKADTTRQNLADAPISMSQLQGITVHSVTQAKVKPQNVQLKYTNCKLNLRKLVHHKREMYLADVTQSELQEKTQKLGLISESWRLQGHLVSHLVEHEGPIHRVAVSPRSLHFATVSSDHKLKLWDCEKFEGKGLVNQSKATCSAVSQKLYCVTFCGEEKVVFSTEKGEVYAINVENMSSQSNVASGSRRLSSEGIVSLDVKDANCVMDMVSFPNSQVIAYITSHGSIDMWDLRDRNPVCALKHDIHDGLLTSLVIDQKGHWLCVGSVSGKHICWDLRFRLPITCVTHPSLAGVCRMAVHPSLPSCVISAAMGNNEISIWDLETSSRNTTLWASTAPALSLRQKTQDSVNGLVVTQHESKLNIYSAGTDSTIRLWDLGKPMNSKIISEHSPPQYVSKATYEMRRIEGTDVLQEHLSKEKRSSAAETFAESGSEIRSSNVETCHRDVITDLGIFHVNQTMLVSTSRDGVIKIWK